MSRPRRPRPRAEGEPPARLFVALDLPDEVRTALAAWGEEAARADPALRPLRAEALHVTLCFLGWLPESASGPIGAALRACAGPPDALGLGAAAWLPPRRPRVLAVDLDDPRGELAALQADVERALAAGGWYRPERRPFRPHVTVARVRAGERRGSRSPSAPPILAAPFVGAAVTLYRSRLGPRGARYEPLARHGPR